MAWVTIDGEYGGSAHISFDGGKMNEVQWENLEQMADTDRYDYVEAVMDGNDATVRLIEFNNFGEEWGL